VKTWVFSRARSGDVDDCCFFVITLPLFIAIVGGYVNMYS